MFDKAKFETGFDIAINTLANNEKTTKEIIRGLSRSILEAVHATENIGYANKFLSALSPVNRKVAVIYLRHFTGFSYDDGQSMFTTKSKKRYDKAAIETRVFLEDPLNNIWVWENINVKHEKKEPTIEGFTKYVTGFMNKTQGKFSQVEILQAVFSAGMNPDALIEALDSIAGLANVDQLKFQTVEEQIAALI